MSLGFRFTALDEFLAASFWQDGSRWRWEGAWLVQFLYRYGTYPALAGCAVGALLWLGYLLGWQSRDRGQLGAFLVALMLLGPGLLVNTVFKDHFGRPRPREIRAFNGPQQFRALGEPDFNAPGRSFPSGHASMGFYWLGLFVYFYGRKPLASASFAVAGLTYGFVMGLGRMAQGGHWASDVLWSCAFVYFSAWFIRWLMFDYRQRRLEPATAGPTAEKSAADKSYAAR